jgi:hypothetical protein
MMRLRSLAVLVLSSTAQFMDGLAMWVAGELDLDHAQDSAEFAILETHNGHSLTANEK